MSRVKLIEKLKMKKNSSSIKNFDYFKLWAPPILSIFTIDDINQLKSIATSIKYNNNITKKYELIDEIMRKRGFVKAHSGTNRVVYNYLESSAFIAKVAIDRVGMKDSPAEFINQQYFQPFCCRIFEVDPSGVIAFVERVNPISSMEEFLSVAEDVFNMMVTKIIGKYVVDDLGSRSYMNFGVRQNANGTTFGPVVIDFPYAYEIDGDKLYCNKEIIDPFTKMKYRCNGEIDYKPGFNGLHCTKCGKEYKAIDLAKTTRGNFKLDFDYETNDQMVKDVKYGGRARIIDGNNTITDSGKISKCYLTEKELDMKKYKNNGKNNRNNNKKKKSLHETRKNHYSELQKQYYMERNNMNNDFVNNPRFVNINNLEGEEMMDVVTYTGSLVVAKSTSGPLTELEEIDLIHQRKMNKMMEMEQEIENNSIPNEMLDNEVTATVISVEDIPNEAEQVSVINNTVITEEPKSNTPVYSDEEIQKMIDAISSRNNEDTVVSNENILDKEADAAMINPLNRPYTRITMNQSRVIPDNFDLKYIYHTYEVMGLKEAMGLEEENDDEIKNIVKVHVKVTNTNPNDKCLFSSDEFSRIIYNDIEIYPSSAFDGKLIDPKQSIEMIFQYDITELIEVLEEDFYTAEEVINVNVYIEIDNNENIEIKEIYDEYINDDDPEDDPYEGAYDEEYKE